jgi:hypothetical protein
MRLARFVAALCLVTLSACARQRDWRVGDVCSVTRADGFHVEGFGIAKIASASEASLVLELYEPKLEHRPTSADFTGLRAVESVSVERGAFPLWFPVFIRSESPQ